MVDTSEEPADTDPEADRQQRIKAELTIADDTPRRRDNVPVFDEAREQRAVRDMLVGFDHTEEDLAKMSEDEQCELLLNHLDADVPQSQRRCGYCHELGHDRRTCAERKFWADIEADKQDRAEKIEMLQKQVGGHQQKIAKLKNAHAIALLKARQEAEEAFRKKQQADKQPFIVRHWQAAASLCGTAITMGMTHFDLIPWPEVVVPVSLTLAAIVVVLFLFCSIRFSLRKVRPAFPDNGPPEES
jgi:hypothetical protein